MSVEKSFKAILGLGFESTHYYLKEINKKIARQKHLRLTYPFLIYQIDFQEINQHLPDQFAELISTIKIHFNHLAHLGITDLLVPNITLHETLDQMDLPLKIYHPILLAIQKLKKNSCDEVFIFGTAYTMNAAYVKDKLAAENITLKIPTLKDQDWIDNFRKKVFSKEETTLDINYFQDLIKKYAAEHPVLIACTELSLYSLKENANCIDLADLQIAAFLNT